MSSTIRTYSFTQDGIEHGPYFKSQILSLINSGAIKANTKISASSGEHTNAYLLLTENEVPEGQKDRSSSIAISDINMPFLSMVGFMIKWALASIPAAIIFFMLLAIFTAIFGGMLGGIFYSLSHQY